MSPSLPIRSDRRQLLKAAAQLSVAAPSFQLVPSLLADDQPPKKKVLFFTKSQTFEHSVIRRTSDAPSHAGRLLSEFAGKAGFEIFETKDGSVFDGDLKQYDAIFFFTTGDLTKTAGDKSEPMSERGKENLLQAIASGTGMIGSHCASDTFHSQGAAFETQVERDPYIDMLGGEFIRHGRQQDALQRVVNSTFPGLQAAGEGFNMHEEWYSLKNFAPDLHVILVQETKGMKGLDYERPPFPATWARMQKQGRVFYTSMGHREDVWENPIFQSVVVGGLQWITRQADADITPNIQQVTPLADQLPKPG